MLVGMYFDAFGAEWKKTLFTGAEVGYSLAGMEGTWRIHNYFVNMIKS